MTPTGRTCIASAIAAGSLAMFLLIVLALAPVNLLQRHPLFDYDGFLKSHERQNDIAFQIRVDRQVTSQSLLFFGDSQVKGFCAACYFPNAVNFGVGHDTSQLLLERLPRYRSITGENSVVLLLGINDVLTKTPLNTFQKNVKDIFALLQLTDRFYVISIHPVGNGFSYDSDSINESVALANSVMENLCTAEKKCKFLDLGQLFPRSCQNVSTTLSPDQLHYSEYGYQCLANLLKLELY